MDDGALVQAVRDGRTELFAELVERHAAALGRVVRAAVRQEADAEDIAQEAFLASFAGLDRLRDPRRFRAHLLAIAARKAIDHLRRKKVRARVGPLIEEPAAPDPGEAPALVAAVERVVERMDATARLVFALRHHEGLSCVQIARLLDVSKGTVYSRISRTHAAIRRAMEVAE